MCGLNKLIYIVLASIGLSMIGCRAMATPPPPPALAPTWTNTPPIGTATPMLLPTPVPTENMPHRDATAVDGEQALPTAAATATPIPPAATGLPVATVSEPAIDIIVDNLDPGFSTTVMDPWYIGDGGQSYNGNCAYTPIGIGGIAYVNPQLPQAGSYEVFAWWCGDPNHDQARRAEIMIYPTVGRIAPYTVYVNLQENAGQWNSLGTYYLETNGSLSINGSPAGNVVADAFRFVYRSPERLTITPTPLPTPQEWTHYPPSPLEQLTSANLAARLALVQPYITIYPVIVATAEATFDSCATFPHAACGGALLGALVHVQYQDLMVSYAVSQDYHYAVMLPNEPVNQRQRRYLSGWQPDGRAFNVYHDTYGADRWYLVGVSPDNGGAMTGPLDEAQLATLRQLVQRYNTIVLETADNLQLTLYGQGPQVALSDQDSATLSMLGRALLERTPP